MQHGPAGVAPPCLLQCTYNPGSHSRAPAVDPRYLLKAIAVGVVEAAAQAVTSPVSSLTHKVAALEQRVEAALGVGGGGGAGGGAGAGHRRRSCGAGSAMEEGAGHHRRRSSGAGSAMEEGTSPHQPLLAEAGSKKGM